MNYSGLRGGWKWAGNGVAVAGLYYIAARLGLLLAFDGTNASPVWPPSGIAVAAVFLLGYRVWPAIAIGALAANLVVFAANQAAAGSAIAAVSAVIAAGNTLEALLGVFLLRRLVGSRSPFDEPQDVFKFALAAVLAGALGASIGTVSLLLSGIAPNGFSAMVWMTWWLGDVTGILIVAPLIIICRTAPQAEGKPRSRPEITISLVLLLVLGALIFGGQLIEGSAGRPVAYLFLPGIAWAAYRYGSKGVAITAFLITGLAVWATTQGRGPFASGNLNDALIVLECFVGLCSVTGLILAADLSERKRLLGASAPLREIVAPWVTLLVCIGVTVLGWHLVASGTERRARDRFDFLADGIRTSIVERMLAYEQVLRGAAGLFAAAQSVDRSQWHNYVQRLKVEQDFPGIQGIGYAEKIDPAGLDAHVRQIRAEGYIDYAIRPAGERAAYTPVVYLEPFSGRNLRAFGYDMFSEPVRRAAMMQARDAGDIAVSGKVILVQETGQDVQAGFLMYLPVYRSGAPTGTIEERRAALVGYVYSPFRMTNLMQGILGKEMPALALAIHDGTAVGGSTLMYDSGAPGRRRRTGAPMFTAQGVLDMENHAWTLRFSSLPAFEAMIDRQKAQIVLFAGVLISLLFFVLVRSLALTRQRATALAHDMTGALRESEAKFRSLAESAGEAIIIADQDGCIVSWNRGAEAIFGYTEQEMIGEELTRLMPERYREGHREGLARMRSTGETRMIGRTVELSGLSKDGREFPLELSLATWRTGAGLFFSGIIRDISEQKRLWQAQIESRDRLDLAIRGSRLALFEWNIDSGEVYLNEEWANIIGAPAGPTRTTFARLREIVHPDDTANQQKLIYETLKGRSEFYRAEHRVRTQAGEWKWIQSHGKVVERDANGRALKLIGTNADIDYRKQIEQKLEHERQLLAAVLENIDAGIVACDATGKLNLFNRATRNFHHLPAEPLSPEHWAEHYDLFQPDGSPMRTEDIPLIRALKENQVRDIEMMIKPKHGGEQRFLLASGQAMRDASGTKLGAVIALQDITDRKQKEQAIGAALKEKETLLKEVYHRVKNNLQVITSLLNLQQRSLPEGLARTALKESTNRVRSMALVHEKLYQSGNLASIDLRDYIVDLCRRLGVAAGVDERGITVSCVVEPIEIGLDTAVPLGLLLNELISNSLKHGFPADAGGEVQIRVVRQGATMVSLTVADNGVGLPAERDRASSTSLGMKLVETLSRQLDGKFSLESTRGTRATLLFPLRSPAAKDEKRAAPVFDL